MERRRLKLHGTDSLTPASWEVVEPRLWLPGRCLAVVDTEQGQAASLWALSLLQACSTGLGHRLPVVLTAFERAPEPLRAFREALEAVSAQVLVRAVAPTPAGAQALLSELEPQVAEAPCWLMVGVPAVLAFESSFQILVLGEQPPERWLPALRRLRSTFSLEVPASASPALFPALARALVGS